MLRLQYLTESHLPSAYIELDVGRPVLEKDVAYRWAIDPDVLFTMCLDVQDSLQPEVAQ